MLDGGSQGGVPRVGPGGAGGEALGARCRGGAHHEQIAAHHTGSADFGERVQDVVQGGGGEGVDLLGRVLRQGVLRQLERQGGSEGQEGRAASGRHSTGPTPTCTKRRCQACSTVPACSSLQPMSCVW